MFCFIVLPSKILEDHMLVHDCEMLLMAAFCYGNWSNQSGCAESICIASGSHWHVDNWPKRTSWGGVKMHCWNHFMATVHPISANGFSWLIARIQITMLPESFTCWHTGVLQLHFDDGFKCKKKKKMPFLQVWCQTPQHPASKSVKVHKMSQRSLADKLVFIYKYSTFKLGNLYHQQLLQLYLM